MKNARQSQFTLHHGDPSNGQRVYNGKVIGDVVTIGCGGHHGGWWSQLFFYISPHRIKYWNIFYQSFKYLPNYGEPSKHRMK